MEWVNWLPDGIFGVYSDFWGSNRYFLMGRSPNPSATTTAEERPQGTLAQTESTPWYALTTWESPNLDKGFMALGNSHVWMVFTVSHWSWWGQKQRLQSFSSRVFITWRLWAAAWITMESQAHVYPSVVPVHSRPIRMSRWWTCQLCMSVTEMPRL